MLLCLARLLKAKGMYFFKLKVLTTSHVGSQNDDLELRPYRLNRVSQGVGGQNGGQEYHFQLCSGHS